MEERRKEMQLSQVEQSMLKKKRKNNVVYV
jgi:hypothetical protein